MTVICHLCGKPTNEIVRICMHCNQIYKTVEGIDDTYKWYPDDEVESEDNP
jgi:hypothetical protein